eukprot:TRINITY_DN1693_c0_g1_i4.p1 TRINITY_DN1693_c0_g1~~TRINITY_DN1693_c0_g1_i4.p1  ORF type:complete len:477 (+),score=168.28 TRINITY_DN1693_c0_g1_i4:147-1433(+)
MMRALLLLAAATYVAEATVLFADRGNCRRDSHCHEGYRCEMPHPGECTDGVPLLARFQDCEARPTCCRAGLKCVSLLFASRCLEEHFYVGKCVVAPPPVQPQPIVRKTIDNRNGLTVSYLECGQPFAGPLVVFLHGFPELSDSWRPQLEYFGARGFWAVAPDLRGFGETTGGDGSVESMQVLNLAKDTVGLLQALNVTSAVLVGHDLGAVPAYFTSQFRPDMVRGVALASLPLGLLPPVMDANPFAQEEAFEALLGSVGMASYQSYLRTGAEADVAADPEGWLRKMYYLGSAESGFRVDVATGQLYPIAYPAAGDLFMYVPNPVPEQPQFAELISRQAQFLAASGDKTPLTYYNVTYLDVQQLFTGRTAQLPYYFIAGEHEFVNGYEMLEQVPGFVGKARVPNSGHWLQHENPDATNELLQVFLQRFQ